ncbi:MAG: alpha/beta fold hydrolase [Bacillota bacterium]|uniref:alpha/beta fold hydrolase n=1 Tax=Bacillus sp. RO2 TaxID=2723913 RepID=UPI00145E80FE|nr:alpha/beta fold hydrolase [Bacillus sp. RO2]MEA3321935.1 alpha/beta fold hydrolase [Bacillota bacterium]NMH75480.1 alpha/beta fold hydrolase [Bacillus sp. RO2]
MKKWQKISLVTLGIVVGVAAAACLFLIATPYKLVNQESRESTDEVTVKENSGWISFFPTEESDEAGIIFYPGGRVEAAAYAPLGKMLAEQGVPFIIAKMPLHLAVLNPEKADKIIEKYDDREWLIAGHSLGGAMAAKYVKNNPDKITGLILMAAYPSEDDDLTTFKGDVITFEAQLDGVIDEEKLTKADSRLPSQMYTFIIQGGNHSQFGDYGLQKGDNEASISKEEQWKRIVQGIVRSF